MKASKKHQELNLHFDAPHMHPHLLRTSAMFLFVLSFVNIQAGECRLYGVLVIDGKWGDEGCLRVLWAATQAWRCFVLSFVCVRVCFLSD